MTFHKYLLFFLTGVLIAGTVAGAEISAVAVGHEYRQDDLPSLAAAPDGSLWVSWLSFAGDRDDVAIRNYRDGKWGTLQWAPGTSGDSWLPQVAVDSRGRVHVVWSQMADGNWDIYARWFDPTEQEWGPLERLTSHPLPDINPRLAASAKGRFALVWQGFRGKHSDIFLREFDGERWEPEVRVTMLNSNEWEPSAAIDSSGAVWVAYDSYRNGNYDVYLRRVQSGEPGEELPVAVTPLYEAQATVAVDTADRVWVAWDSGRPGWGKDQGYVIRDNPSGVPLGAFREPRVRCWANGQWRSPARTLASAFSGARNTYHPHVFSDGRGSVWVIAKKRINVRRPNRKGNRGYWEYWVTGYDGAGWREAFALPHSKGRSSTRPGAALGPDGSLWMAWDTDNREPGQYHRPHRQQVWAGSVPAPPPPGSMQWGEPPADKIEALRGHDDEPADIRAIRTYTADPGGRELHIVRGDFHRHTELSWDGGGRNDGSLQEFYRYMIDAAAMDFGASTDHQGGAWPYWWWYTQKMTDMYHVPGAYVPIFGYERSARFPNGHRNVFFAKRSDSRVTPFHLKMGSRGYGIPVSAMGDEPGVGAGSLVENDTKLLYEDVRDRNAVLISHTSSTRMGTDWRDNDPDLEPVVEIFQGCRTSSERVGAPLVAKAPTDQALMKRAGYQPEGMVNNAWAKGYKLGIISSSDHGSTHISYAMVYTDDFSRQGILDAIRRRHTYGATDNIILDVRMGERFMGDEFRLRRVAPLRVKVIGPRLIVKVDIIKDNEVVYSTSPDRRRVEFEFVDKGPVEGRHFYYVRVQQEDRMVAWSSPMFINYD